MHLLSAQIKYDDVLTDTQKEKLLEPYADKKVRGKDLED